MQALIRSNPVLLLFVSPFLDGYLTVAAGFVIASLFNGENPLGASFYAGSFLAGTFLGALLIGRLADRLGRMPFCRWLLLAPCIASLVPFVTAHPVVLIAAQFVIGLFIGADQPVSQAIVTEQSLAQQRSRRLSALMLVWYVGALIAVLGQAVLFFTSWLDPDDWPLFYAVPAILCALSLPLRRLLSSETAKPVFKSQAMSCPARLLLHYWRRLVFCCGFWSFQTLPVTVVMFYSPTILEELTGSPNQLVQIGLIYVFFLLGTLPMTAGRLKLSNLQVLLLSFFLMGAGLLGLSFTTSVAALGLLFVLYAFGYGLQSVLDYALPNQLFPTEIRATATGLIFSVTRLASVLSAFLFPILMSQLCVEALFFFGALLSFAGMLWPLVLPRCDWRRCD